MASALIVPGVQVKFEFEPAPVLPGATGILGVVGVTDYGPLAPTPVGSFSEFLDIFGPASAFSMPEVRAAFTSGVKEVVVARIASGAGTKASLLLKGDNTDEIVTLEARAEGVWGKDLSAKVEQVRTLDGSGVKHVNLTLLRNGEVIETLNNLVMDETSPGYLFDQINTTSRAIVAYDPVLAKSLPEDVPRSELVETDLRRATAKLRAGASDVLEVTAKKPGRQGNILGVAVKDGRYGFEHAGLDISAKLAGTAAAISFSVENNADNEIKLTIFGAGDPAIYSSKTGLDDLLKKAAANADVEIGKLKDLPLGPKGKTNLERRITIELAADGKATVVYPAQPGPDLAKLDDIVALKDPTVEFKKAANATALPDTAAGVLLTGGRPVGPAFALTNSGQDVLELQKRDNIPQAAPGDKIAIEVRNGKSSVDGTTPVVNLTVFLNGNQVESFTDLTMDPDDPNYMPAVLQNSRFLSGVDLFVRSKLTSMPSNNGVRAQPFNGGTSPSVSDYQGALERLETAEEVDLVIASVGGQLDDEGIVAVHQLVQAHCTKMVGTMRNRIGLGSVTSAASRAPAGKRVQAILSHADLVRSNDFILTTPAGSEAAVAGLLSLQDYFQSPTFKTVTALGVPPGDYTDSELNQLVAGNVVVVNQKRRLGTIVIKGVLTGGRQINVQRTANKAVRDVKAIADVYIGLLNNEGNRNALRQQIIALFLQMTLDGALVPSTDGKEPPFKVDVRSPEADFAAGIVRVDIAIRPVRSIDYVYATILVQN